MYKFHEAANAFPMMSDAELHELAEDIKAHGQRVPITIFDGKILDGRNRYKACELASVKPNVVEYTDTQDPYMWVWSLNGERRHLSSQEQKATIWSKLYSMSESAMAKRAEIKTAADKARSEATKLRPRNENGTMTTSGGTDCTTTGRTHQSRAWEADQAGVNKGAMARAKSLHNKSPELSDKVAAGEITYAEAKRQTTKEVKHKNTHIVSDAARYVNMANRQLDRILPNDPNAKKELNRLIGLIEKRKATYE